MNKVISVNTDGMLSRIMQLSEKINEHNPGVIALQDLPYSRNHSLRQVLNKITPEFTLIEEAEDSSSPIAENNVALLINLAKIKLIKVHRREHMSRQNRAASALAISINTNQNNDETTRGNMIIASIYIRPRATHAETDSCLKWIEQVGKSNEGLSRSLILGDFNAYSPLWAPTDEATSNNETSHKHYRMIKETRGRFIEKTTNRLKLTCLNNPKLGPTYKMSDREAYIDLVFAGSKTSRQWNKIKLEDLTPNKGHKLVIVQSSFRERGPQTKQNPPRTLKRIDTEQLQQELFLEVSVRSQELIQNWQCLPTDRIRLRLDKLTNLLYRGLLAAQEKITITRVQRKLTKRFKLGKANARTRKQLRRLKDMEETINQLKRETRRRARGQEKTRQKQLKDRIKKSKVRLNMTKRKLINCINISNVEERLNTDTREDVWQAVRLANTQNTDTMNQDPTNDQLKTQEQIDELARQKFPTTIRKMQTYTKQAVEDLQLYWQQVERKEIDIAIKALKKKSYTSPEGISMTVFVKSIEFTREIIYAIAQMSFRTAYIPKACHATLGTLIPKKKPGEFRIVHVSSPLAALLELIALRRLEYRLECNKLNSPYQFGFSALRGRHDLISRILELAMKHKNREHKAAVTTLVSVDIKGAFDNVNQDKLIQKMDKEFGRDPLKYWLAEFILNRRIRIKRGKIVSQERTVCTGVPQGSALGPILWNYAINDIERDLASPGRTEMLKYADDIIIVHNSLTREPTERIVQMHVNKLTERLKTLDLELCPDKCCFLCTQPLRANNAKPREPIKINGQEIRRTGTLNILGVSINDKLKLDRANGGIKEGVSDAIRKLHNIAQLEMINTAQEWRTLIDSLIKSKLIINNWPLLAIDKTASKYIDKLFINSMRTIFNWPKNCSAKLVKLLTDYTDSHTAAIRMAQMKRKGELGKTYEFLCATADPMTSPQLKEQPTHRLNRVFNLEENSLSTRRKQPNPNKIPAIVNASNPRQLTQQVGPIWALLDKKKGSLMVELLDDNNILQRIAGRHTDYPISYFNSFALLLKSVRDKNITSRHIVMSETSSILMAIENFSNHDWRVIRLREELYENGWTIHRVPSSPYKRLASQIRDIYKNLALRHDTSSVENFELWTMLMEEQVNNNTDRRREEEEEAPLMVIENLNTPYLVDYKDRNRLNTSYRGEDAARRQDSHTKLTRILCNKPETWQAITPNWLDGTKILMLSGIVMTDGGHLAKGELDNPIECEHCTSPTSRLRQTTNNKLGWHNMSDQQARQHITLHRAIECQRFNEARERLEKELERELNNHELDRISRTNGIELGLKDKRTGQKILRYLAKCAMNKP